GHDGRHALHGAARAATAYRRLAAREARGHRHSRRHDRRGASLRSARMDGVHDMGGRQGFGRVRYSFNATAFHAPWEVRANSLYALAVRAGIFNMDEYRHAIERMEPRHYLSASYYERSLTSLLTLCVE